MVAEAHICGRRTESSFRPSTDKLRNKGKLTAFRAGTAPSIRIAKALAFAKGKHACRKRGCASLGGPASSGGWVAQGPQRP